MSNDTIVIIGGGHNGLVAAACLAQRGRKVHVLEARSHLGGLCAGQEFAPGYSHAGILHDTSGLWSEVVETLNLSKHGLTFASDPERIWAPTDEGPHLWFDSKNLCPEASPKDQAAYQQWVAFLDRVTPVIRRVMSQAPAPPSGSVWPWLKTAIGVRRLGVGDMTELLRILPMCSADWLRDTFETERLSAALSLPSMTPTWAGPWSPSTASNLLLAHQPGARSVAGGPAALVSCLAAAATAAGATLETDRTVARIHLDGDRVNGVELEDGERLAASHVLSTASPKRTLLDLVGESELPIDLSEDIHRARSRGTVAKLHLALHGPLELADGQRVTRMRTGQKLDDIERAFDAVKYDDVAIHPVLDVWVPSESNAELCPSGHAVVSALVYCCSHKVTDSTSRQALEERAVAELARHCPSVADRIVGSETLLPHDLEARFGLPGGHLHHLEHAPDQLLFMRPTVQCSQYRTPIDGLWLGGSGSHPSGGVTGAPGMLAARAMLKA